jgi:23S rRNA (adenine2503-C2)-methyltransferase
LNGFCRNLSANEIIREVELLSGVAGISRFNHVSFMGIGEPLDNFENVVIAIRRLVEIDLWYAKRISLATVGLLPQMYQLAQLGLPLKMLWVSLHAADDDKRRQIMPISNLYGVEETVDTAIDFMEMTGTKTWINYMVMPHFNDSIEDAKMLTSLLSGRGSGLSVMVTLPNPGTIGCSEGGVDDVSRFIEKLTSCGMKNRITRFFAAGRPIKAGCGEFLFYPGSTK